MLLIAAAIGGAAHSVLKVFGPGFSRATPALALLALFPALASITATQTQALWATNRPGRTSLIAMVRLVITIGCWWYSRRASASSDPRSPCWRATGGHRAERDRAASRFDPPAARYLAAARAPGRRGRLCNRVCGGSWSRACGPLHSRAASLPPSGGYRLRRDVCALRRYQPSRPRPAEGGRRPSPIPPPATNKLTPAAARGRTGYGGSNRRPRRQRARGAGGATGRGGRAGADHDRHIASPS